MTCLRTELPEIKAQLKEYTDILGSYDAAYYVLSENNGYGLEFDSEGKDSKLYQDLLSHFNNDSKMAIREKSKVFLISFKNTYKDLTIEPTAQQVLEYQSQDSLSEEAKSFFDTDKDLRERVDQAYNDLEIGLEQTKDNYNSKEKEELDSILRDINVKILKGLQSRLKVNTNPDPELRTKIKKESEWLIANISEGLKSDLDNINEFLANLRFELRPTFEYLVNVRRKGLDIDDTKLNDLDQNFFGFYNDIVDEIVSQLIYKDNYREIIGKDSSGEYILDRMLKRAKDYQAMLTDGYSIVKGKIADNARQNLKQVGLEVKSSTIYDYSMSNPSPSQRDIAWLTYYIGAGDKINNDSIKTIFYLINKAEEETNRNTYQVIRKLEDLLSKAGKYNQRMLFEVDDDGNTTGYIVRARNYGKFEKNYANAMKKIASELGVDLTDIKAPENRQLRIEYNKRRNEWLSKHTDRRYTREYYDMFNHLSEGTVAAREEIQLKIRQLVDKTRDSVGIAHLDRLSDKEYNTYRAYLLEKKQLASLYDTTGIKKQGEKLKIAEELQELNKKLSEGLTMTKNSKAYEEEKAKIMADSNLTKEQKQKWLERNSQVRYKDEFYQKLEKLEKKYYGPVYAELQERRRSILNQHRDDMTGNIDIDHMSANSKAAIQRLSRQMSIIRKNKKVEIQEGDAKFEDIAETIPTEQWYRDLKKYYYNVVLEDPESAEMWLKANAYDIKNPKAWYTKVVPKDKSLIEYAPNSNWLEVSKESKFYNKSYYETQEKYPDLQNEYWIPKSKVIENGKIVESYDNSKNYHKVMDNEALKNLRQAILDTIKESNDKLTNLHKTYPYRVPQKSGSLLKYIHAGWKRNYISGAFKGFIDYWKDLISCRNDDVGFNRALTKPNGERLNVIPQYYLKRLDNPEYLTADLVGSVIQFYKSCESWKNKTQIQPRIEILKRYVQGIKYTNKRGEEKTGNSNTYKFVKNFIDMNLYDIKTQDVSVRYGDNPTGKVLGLIPYKGNVFGLTYDISKPREINITKMLSILKMLGTLRNLGLNLACALTGAYTALHQHITNMLIQRYYNPIDAGHALFDIVADSFFAISNVLGVSRKKTFITQAMELFEIGAEINPNATNRMQLVNAVTKHWAFGPYSLMDHVVKGQILASVMHNFKLVEEGGKKIFMSREEYKRKHKLPTYAPGDYMDWNLGNKTSFYDAVEFVGGKMVAKDKTNQKAVDEAMNKIAYIAKTLAQSADGQLTSLQKPVILANWAGQFVMMHRQYLPVVLQERWLMTRQWDYQAQRYREGVFKTVVRLFDNAIENNENVIKTYKRLNQEDPLVRENLARLVFEGILYGGLVWFLRPLLEQSADDDKKNIIKQLLAYTIIRSQFETLAPYNLLDMASIIKSPSAITDYVSNMFELFSNPVSLLYERIKYWWLKETYYDATIKRGAYKGWTEQERNLLKLTPFRNIQELKDIQSKRNYYKKQILGE